MEQARFREVVREVASNRGVAPSFAAPRPGDWRVEIDGCPAFPVERSRDDAANTVVRLTPSEFRERVADFLQE